MKTRFVAYSLLAFVLAATACKKDNYDAPSSNLTGRIVYQNQPIGVRTNGVELELWQPGYQLSGKIRMYVAQDGSFSASLFDGDYKLIPVRGNGPWMENTDTIRVQVRGSAKVDVPVKPYFLITNAQIGKTGEVFTATCKVEEVNAGKAVENVTLFVNTTQFVDNNNNAGRFELKGPAITDLSQALSLSITPPESLVKKGYGYARLGLRIVGVPEMIYTPVQKIQL